MTADDLLLFAGVPAMTLLALVLGRLIWVKKFSLYDRYAPPWVGPSARAGYDAGAAFLVVPLLCASLMEVADLGAGQSLPDALAVVGLVGMLVGFAVCLLLLLFMRPRVLAPPHLRRERGWVIEALHDSRPRR